MVINKKKHEEYLFPFIIKKLIYVYMKETAGKINK